MKDLVVIGGGPGGYVAAIRATQLGMSVSLVEKDSVGGTCLNRGCIPTKSYYQNASVLRTLARLGDFNVKAGEVSFDMAGARERKNKIVSGLASGIGDLLRSHKVEMISGEAAIASPGRVLVSGEEIEAKRVLIAAGSCPARLAIPGSDLPGVITSDEILDLDAPPRCLAIIGGGVIGLELACIFKAFGSQVTVFEFSPDIIGMLDREIIRRMGIYLKKQGITVNTGATVQRIELGDDGLTVTAQGKRGEICCSADAVLVAVGRRSLTDGLDLESLGIAHNKGFITVDDNYETSVPGIFAIGDVVGKQMLAHVASEEGIVAVERMCGLAASVDYDAIPSCIFTFPEIATVGLSQEEAQARGLKVKVGKFQFAANGKAMAMGETDGFVKVVAASDGTILGIHIIGPHASDLIQEASLIVKERMKLRNVIETVHPHPTLGEALHEAIMDADGRAIHLRPKR
jgi:dihydrolipoamide dehydrogenase